VNLSQLQQLAASVGFPDPALAAAVAMAESGGNPNAYNTEGSYGLWQIDIVYHPEFQSDPTVLFDPTTNAQAAYSISSRGANWNPWTTYRTGAYLRWYTPQTTAPAPTPTSQPFVATSAITPTGVILTAAAILGIGVATWAGYNEIRRRRLLPRYA
jgi:hypothetical protein